jgi:hypothetical protein
MMGCTPGATDRFRYPDQPARREQAVREIYHRAFMAAGLLDE